MHLVGLEADLVAGARVGGHGVHERLAVYADLLQERDDLLGRALEACLRDPSLEVLGLQTFAGDNDVEGRREYELLVCRYRPFARAMWLPPHLRSLDAELVLLPPLGGPSGFMMGSHDDERGHDEHPHRVEIARPFLIGRTTVSQQIYDHCGGEHGPYEWTGDELPASNLSWYEADQWTGKLGLRLPSEAEWEFAARAGTGTPFHFGRQVYPDQANVGGDAFGAIRAMGEPVRVGSMPGNAFGLHEVHGNVWEWCADHWGRYDRTPVDGEAHLDPSVHERICRGGSCHDYAEQCRSASRHAEEPSMRSEILGFRVARDVV